MQIEKSKKKAQVLNVEKETFDKEKLENEINYLITLLYGLSQALNEKEQSMNEHTDPELLSIYKADCIAISDDFIKIAEQVKIRLSMFIQIANEEGEPVDLDYFRLYKTLTKLIEL